MGQEHAPETVWKAQELYCSDRLSFVRVAEITGVADSTLRRWADTYGWREKRDELARAEAEIRADKVLARAKAIKVFLDKPRADMGFAITSLEAMALKEAEAARAWAKKDAGQQGPTVSVTSMAEALPLLRQAVQKKLAALLSNPELVDLKGIQEVQKCLALIGELAAAQPQAQDASAGMGADLVARIEAAMRGEL